MNHRARGEPDDPGALRFCPVVNEAPRTLTPEQIHRFNRDGFIDDLVLFDADEATTKRRYFDGLLEQTLARRRDAYSINGYQSRCQGIYDIATHPYLLDCVEDLIGPDIVCWGTHYFCKLPGDVREVPYHQDAVYWPFRPARAVTVWLAIDTVAADNGPMCFLPGSHLQGPLAWRRRTRDVVLDREVAQREHLGDPHSLLIEAGHFSLHTDLLVHGSAPNASPRRRCGLTLRYVPPEVWVADEARIGWTRSAIRCRGHDPTGRWPHNPRPLGDEIR